jgi:uncharacterized protein
VSTMDPTWDRELGTASPHREEINLLTSGLGPKTPLFRLAMFRRGKMKLPQITATYVAILALLYATLSLAIVRLRQRNRVAFGDGGNSDLRSAIRAHAHFAEYVPIIALMASVLEMSGLPTIQMHVLMGALLTGRLLHPFGMYAGPQTLQFRIFRVGGMVITTLVMITCSLLILVRGGLL